MPATVPSRTNDNEPGANPGRGPSGSSIKVTGLVLRLRKVVFVSETPRMVVSASFACRLARLVGWQLPLAHDVSTRAVPWVAVIATLIPAADTDPMGARG